jgi:hypothetical protein
MLLHGLQFTRTCHNYFHSVVSSPVLWYRLLAADVSLLLVSRTVLVPQSQQFLANSHSTNIFWRRLTVDWISLHLSRTLSLYNSLLFKSKSKLYYYRQSVGQSVLVSSTHLGPATNFFHSLFDYFFDSFGFVDVGLPLWREDRSELFSFCRVSPAQPLSDLNPTKLMSIVYCLYF